MTDFAPHYHPDGHIAFVCPWCGTTYKGSYRDIFFDGEGREARIISVICHNEKCAKKFLVRNDGAVKKVLPKWKEWLLRITIAMVAPFLWIDMKVNGVLDRVCTFLQKLSMVSKYWIIVAAYMVGLMSIGVHDPILNGGFFSLFSALVWLFISREEIRWAIRKARYDSDVDAEVIDPQDQKILGGAVAMRLILFMLLAPMTIIPLALTIILYILGEEPGVSLYSVFGPRDIGFLLIYMALHWVTSSYLPPWQRKLMEGFQTSESGV